MMRIMRIMIIGWSAHNDPSRFIPLYCQKSFPQLFDVTELNVKPGHLNISSIVEQSSTLVLNQVMLHFPEACQMPSLTTIYSLLLYYEIRSVASICYMS